MARTLLETQMSLYWAAYYAMGNVFQILVNLGSAANALCSLPIQLIQMLSRV